MLFCDGVAVNGQIAYTFFIFNALRHFIQIDDRGFLQYGHLNEVAVRINEFGIAKGLQIILCLLLGQTCLGI